MHRIIVSFLIVALFFIQSSIVSAASKKTSGGGSVSTSAQLIKKRNAVRTYFGNLKGVKSVSYTLFYQANGVGQGVEGTFSPGKKKSWSKDLYLGTCSGKVCVAHRNIKNIQMEVKTKFTNGKTSTKLIKIK
ncbi:MAG: hypothetical protein HYV40_06760 [Candidatus Levybacteria bacterium]|nr:hypothetical protein [Candidatus Levybacteria bacterium]